MNSYTTSYYYYLDLCHKNILSQGVLWDLIQVDLGIKEQLPQKYKINPYENVTFTFWTLWYCLGQIDLGYYWGFIKSTIELNNNNNT